MRHVLAGAMTAAVLAGAVFTSSVPADETPTPSPSVTPRLLEPGGDHPVGMVTLHLEDRDRADPWVPGH